MIRKNTIEHLFKTMQDRHKEMWEELIETGRLKKKTTIVLGDFPKTKNDCFACEFVERMRLITGKPFEKCQKVCPITWVPKKDLVKFEGLACEHPNSPYKKWSDSKTINRTKRRDYAKIILNLKWTNKFLRLIHLS